MNEKQYAKNILKELTIAKKELQQNETDGIVLCRPISILEELNLNFDKLKEESEKLGFHLNYSKEVNSKWWKRQQNSLVFYFNESDL